MNTIEELYGKIIKSKCFLCNKEFDGADNEEVCLLFDKRLDENGIESCSFAEVLSSILGRFIHESIAHSNLICQSCVDMIENYEIVEQNLIGIKHNIIENFNKSSKENNIPEIYVDDIILNEDNVVDGVVDVNASANEDKRIENESFSIINVINENNSPECILYDNYDQQQQQEDNNVEENDLIDEKRIKMIKQDNNNAQIGEVNEENNIIVKQEIENENESEEEEEEEEELFVQNDDENMIEIITGDDVNNEEMIDQLNDESEYCDENNTSNEMDSNVDDENINLENDNSKTKEKHSQSSSVSSIRSKRKYGQLNPPTEPVYSINGEKMICLICNPPNENELDEIENLNQKIIEFDFRTISIHLRTMHKIRVYICDICGTEFNKRSEMINHVDEKHGDTEDGLFPCQICNRVFKNLRLFRVHKRLHSTTGKQFPCSECEKKFISKNLLMEHMNIHTGERPYNCSYCSKNFASKYILAAHLKIHQDRPRPYTCTICSKSFFSLQNLQQHEKTHSGVKEFICDVCDKAFGTQHNLDVHKIVHTGKRPFICTICDKAFARRAEIRDHERIHTGERPFTCDICNVSFAQRSNLTTHKRATHLNDKRYKCEHCDRSFKRRRLLDYHVRSTHTGERPFKCETCEASFVYPEHYKKHQRIHTGEKPYSCEVCGKTFNSRDNRNAHRFIHSDKKPYECLICGQGFMRKPVLYNHMQQAGHMNDTIVVNQPRITKEEIKTNETIMIQPTQNEEDQEPTEVIEDNLISENDENIIAIDDKIDYNDDNILNIQELLTYRIMIK